MGYKSINRLAKDINELSSLIESGELSMSQLDTLISNVQTLEERLIVLRYKILENKEKKNSEDNTESNQEAEIPVLFKVEPIEQPSVAPNQTSLIDVIEEIEEEKKPVEVQSALFSMAEEPIEEFKKTKDKPKSIKEKPIKKTKPKPKTIEKKETLVEKLNSAPITDLKKSINLNLKFRFIKALFHNESDTYNNSIEQMNQADSFEKAKSILLEAKTKYQWEEEVEEEALLLELLERKFEE